MTNGSGTTTTPVGAELVRGALELERTDVGLRPHRLPAWTATRGVDAQLAMAESQPSGVRVAVRTHASFVELRARASRIVFGGAPDRVVGVFDLVVDGDLVAQASATSPTVTTIDLISGAAETVPGQVEVLRFDGLRPGPKTVEVWLPHTEAVELVELVTDAPVAPAPARARTWLHHGSSISHGSNADRPTGTWPAVAARAADVDLVNLGFSGSALLDPFVAQVVRDTPADLISIKLGINVVGGDTMRLRTFVPAVHGFLDVIREGHPETPVLVVSPLLCPIHEDTPGPGDFDHEALAAGVVRFRATGDPAEVAAGKLTLRVVREQLAAIVAQRATSDAHLAYLDGLELYGPADAEELPLPDALHPDAATHQRVGERFTALAFGEGGAFSS